MDDKGIIIASSSAPNNTAPDPEYPNYRIWDVKEIWEKLCNASHKVLSTINPSDVSGVTFTTFGVDGTLFSEDGKMLYPVISWQCERTSPIMSKIDKYIPLVELYEESGVLPYSFNTINKFIWFKENKPDLIQKSHRFLFMPSIFAYFLTGNMINDITMAGTSMTTNITNRKLSNTIYDKIGFPIELLGPLAESGTITGTVTKKASEETGIPEKTPVIATGHDTEFAIFGSGAKENQPVLSSGTWEILMVRSKKFMTGKKQLDMEITTEFDAVDGLYDIGNQWIASGMLEWAKRNFYSDVIYNPYEAMISEAENVPSGSNGVTIVPKFYEELKGKGAGQISGLTLESTRGEIYRAMLEALSKRLNEGKTALEQAGGFKTDSIVCVGGGSRNRLWNRLRADYTGVPVKVINQKETTVLGASMFVQSACGNASSPEEAITKVNFKTVVYEPSH